jgi:glycerol-3-phosphate dehydrogenase
MLSRAERISRLKASPEVSVLVIGAGINGIGVFWDLSLQGVDVLLVDRSDYCSGASAASSHMAHGGIRYLENGEFGLVREAVQERNRLIENARHLVHPLPTTFPTFRWFSGLFNAPLKFSGMLDRPSERGALVLRIGMMLYDLFTREQGTVPQHSFKGREGSLREFPLLNPKIVATGTYYDGSILSPERLAIELVADAARANERAIPLNYAGIVDAQGDSVQLQDETTGDQFRVFPRVVINAAGPWIDRVNRVFGQQTSYIGGTKGSHLVLDHPELRQAIGDHEFFFENGDGRIVLIFPLEDRVLVGTSDIRVNDPDQTTLTGEEVRYFLDMIRRVFPSIRVEPSHIVFTFSGVRPLEASAAGLTAQISRDHKIKVNEVGLNSQIPVFSLVGGKWTTFRAFAEQVTDRALERLGLPRRMSTADVKIGGGLEYPETDRARREWIDRVCASSGLPYERTEALFRRYGTRAEEVGLHASADGDELLRSYAGYSPREIEYIVQQEDVVHLDDFLLRRSMLGMLGRTSKEGLTELGEKIGTVLGWNSQMIEFEIQRTIDIMKTRHRMDMDRYLADEELQRSLVTDRQASAS